MKKNNYPTWLVPIEIAKRLKKIGFNEPCLVENVETHSEDYNFINFEEEMCSDVSVMLEDVVFVKNQFLEDDLGIYKHFVLKTAIPTWEQVFEWFREKSFIGTIEYDDFGLHDETHYNYEYMIRNISGDVLFYSANYKNFEKYGEAREALINKLIEVYENN